MPFPLLVVRCACAVGSLMPAGLLLLGFGAGSVLGQAAPESAEGWTSGVAGATSEVRPSSSPYGDGEVSPAFQTSGSGLPFGGLFGGYDGIPEPLPSLVPGRPALGPIGQGLTAELGTSLTYNSNVYEDPFDEVSGLLSASDLSLHYHRGQLSAMGPFVGIDYNLAYFQYFDEELNEGREPYDQDISGFLGVKGAQTTVTLTGSYAANNGNSINQTRLERETLQSNSKDYALSLSGTRKLRRTSINASLGYSLQEFGDEEEMDEAASEALAGTEDLTDLASWDGSLGWTLPQAAPKTDLSLALAFGGSEQQGGVEQTYVSPSLGINYRMSPKTTLFGSIGFDTRRNTSTRYVTTTTTNTTRVVPVEPGTLGPDGLPAVPMTVTTSTSNTTTGTTRPTTPASVTTTGIDGSTTTVTTSTATEEVSFDQRSPTFDIGASWSPDETTAFSIAFSRSTQASALEGQSSSDTTSVTLTASKQFPRGYFASADLSLENSAYVDSFGVEELGSVDGRPENYQRFGLTLGRSLQLRARLALDASLFYQLNKSTGDDPLSIFDQTIAGIRFGLSF